MENRTLGASEGRTLSAALLAPDRADFARDARRFVMGFALAGLFGLALGSRFGLASMAAHAVGVPLAFVVVVVFGAPALFVGLLHGGVDVDAKALFSLMARGAAAAGLVLFGLSPAMALFSLSAESVTSVGALAALGLGAAGFLGQRATFRGVFDGVSFGDVRFFLFRWTFIAFAAVLAARVWWLVLPIAAEAR